MTDTEFKNLTYLLLKQMLPKFNNKELLQLTIAEYSIIKKVYNSNKHLIQSLSELLTPIYTSIFEAIKKYDASKHIPIDHFIKFITKVRSKDEIRKKIRQNEAKKFLENRVINEDGFSVLDRVMDEKSIEEDSQNNLHLMINVLTKQYLTRLNETVHKKCILMIYEQYSAVDIQKTLNISRREYEMIRNDFFQYVRNVWNYDNIYKG